MAAPRATKQTAVPVGAVIVVLAGAPSCGGAGQQASETQRVGVVSDVGRAAADAPPHPLRFHPVQTRSLLLLDPCAQGGSAAGCELKEGSGKEGSESPADGEVKGLLAKGMPAAEAQGAALKEKSARLPSGFHNPMPGGVFAGYRADTGLDIAGSPRPIYAIQSGTLDYSEPGHTLWTGPKDTANCVRFALDAPIPWKKGRMITHVYYAHLSKLEYSQAEGSKKRRHIQAGERLGISGVANHSPHLHIGLLLDGQVEQYWGTFLFEDEIREVLGGYRNGLRLPREDDESRGR